MLKLNQITKCMRLVEDIINSSLFNNIRYSIRNFFKSINNLIYWFPIIWKDRDWDSHYIWEILKHKLTKQANSIAKNNNHTRAQYDAQKMRLCVRLIDKIQEEYYNMEYMDYHDIEMVFGEPDERDRCELTFKTNSENYDDYLKKYPSSVRNVLKNYKHEPVKSRLVRDVAHYNHMKAKRVLFSILENRIEWWWD